MIKMVHSLGNVGMRIAIQYLYQLKMDIIGVHYIYIYIYIHIIYYIFVYIYTYIHIYIYSNWTYFNLGMSWD